MRRPGATSKVAVRLRQVRERERLSLSTLSFLLGVPRPELERLERGDEVAGRVRERVDRWLEGPGRLPSAP